MIKKRFFILATFLMFLIVASNFISAQGYCQTDKDYYHAGETGTFYCYCTNNNERYQTGYIVWKLANGTILQSTSISSGNCKRNYFGTSYTFADDFNVSTNESHVTLFTLYADGTGSVPNWYDLESDKPYAYWNFTGTTPYDCLIKNIRYKDPINLGDVGAVEFEVKDGVTNKSLIYASCTAEGHDVSGAPLVRIPEMGQSFLKTTDKGTIAFIHKMDEIFWETDSTYLFEFHCHSLPNVTNSYNTDQVAFLSNGSVAGMKSCTFVSLFNTGSEDYRQFSTAEAIGIIFLTFFLFGLLIFTIIFQMRLSYKNKIGTDGTLIVPKTKYVKIGFTLVNYALFMWILNLILALSYHTKLTIFSQYFEFLFSALISLSYPLFIVIMIWTLYEIAKDWKFQKKTQELLSLGVRR